jgi:hypothetical protein
MLDRKNINFCISLDGSDFSEYGFDLAMNELMEKEDKINVVHIKQPNQNDLPFQAQSESIKSYADSKLCTRFTSDNYTMKFKDLEDKFSHPILQIYDTLNFLKFDNMVIGFKGPAKKEKGVISKGIQAILTQVHIPVFIIKEYIPRNKCENNGYIWLACIDNYGSRSWRAFNSALNYIRPNDTVLCTHFSSSKEQKDKISVAFTKLCEKYKIENFKTFFPDYDNSKSIAYHINDYINHCDKTPNFVVLGHNPEKYYNKDPMTSPAVEVMKIAQTNIYIDS